MRFRADQHLRRASDFNHVRTQGRRFDCGAFVLYYAPRLASETAVPSPDAALTENPALGKPTPSSAALEISTEFPPPARAGFVASKSAVGNAVARARAKRRLREQFREHQSSFPQGQDLVFVARRSLNGLEPAALRQRFLDLCRKLFPTRAS